MKKNNEGFTLAELLIVVAIIAVLVAVAIPTFATQLEKSRQSTDVSNLRGAYAAARLAEQAQAVSTASAQETMKDAGLADTPSIANKETGSTSNKALLYYFYNPKEGELQQTSTNVMRRTSSNEVVDTSKLSGLIKYAMPTDKGIIVLFSETDAGSGVYELSEIRFGAYSDITAALKT